MQYITTKQQKTLLQKIMTSCKVAEANEGTTNLLCDATIEL